MASTYNRPADYLAWFIRGDDLAILTKKFNSSTNTQNEWVAIDETVTNGILINYLAEPDAVTALTDYPDLDNTLHKFVNQNRADMLERLSLRHKERWTDELVKFGMKKRDKTGGMRVMKPLDYR